MASEVRALAKAVVLFAKLLVVSFAPAKPTGGVVISDSGDRPTAPTR